MVAGKDGFTAVRFGYINLQAPAFATIREEGGGISHQTKSVVHTWQRIRKS